MSAANASEYSMIKQILSLMIFAKKDSPFSGCGAQNLALLQYQCKPSQLGKLSILITR